MTRDDSASLRALAVQCRCLARGCSTADVGASLDEMAVTYDGLADKAAAREREARPREVLQAEPAERP